MFVVVEGVGAALREGAGVLAGVFAGGWGGELAEGAGEGGGCVVF